MTDWTRRDILGAVALAAGCGGGASAGSRSPRVATPRTCAVTEYNGAGPYYKAGAPARTNLVDDRMPGDRMELRGVVLDAHCRPLPGARIDLWHASAAGEYDMDGMKHRAVLRADDAGRYRCATIVPAPYPDRGRMRPRHIHVIVTAPHHAELTTQLYFPDDPHAAGDPQWRQSLVVHLSRPDRAHFDFHLSARFG